ncbi:hypothetical protein AB0N95_01435 [Streptomyces microflavus]|uniref:hypothetical protein n=1 Tax=Streptomyces microflavus TaxID=1919 RepID=UPI0034309A20
MKIRIAIAAVAVTLATVAGCGTRGDATDVNAKPSGTNSPAAAPSYDVHDCRALLERNYDDDALRDASGDPECAHLARGGYLEVVKEVLTGRTDEILEDSVQHVTWDEAWYGTGVEQQQVVCRRLTEDGVETVAREMIDAAGDDSAGDEVEMSQYFFDEKC